MFESSYLALPECEEDSDKHLFQHKPLKKWLKELPADNQGEKARSLFNKIYQMNRIEMEAGDRLKSLELLLSTFIPVQQFLYSRLTPNGFPLDEKSQRIGQLLLDFGRQFVTGYLLVLDSLLAVTKERSTGSDLTLTIQRLLRNLGAVLLVYYRFFLKQPAAIWRDMNKLFRLASKMKLSTAKVKDSALWYGDSTTIDETYKNVAILNIFDPYGLTASEIFDVHHLLEKWAPLVHLNLGVEKKSQWQVDLSASRPPYFASDDVAENGGKWLCTFEFDALLRMVSDHRDLVDEGLGRFNVKDEERHQEKLSLKFLEHLERRMLGHRDEIEETFQKDQEYRLAIGLKATHQYLNQQHESERSVQGEWLATGGGGNRIRCDFSMSEQIAIGSLVSYSPAEDETAIRGLGVVKRIIMKDLTGTVFFEVERLTARVFAAGLQPNVKSSENLTLYQRALAFTQLTDGAVQHIMVVDPIKVNAGKQYRFLVEDDVFPVRLIHQIDFALDCLAFQYEPVVEKKRA